MWTRGTTARRTTRRATPPASNSPASRGRQRDKLARGVRVAWWTGHSQGRYAGSQWYADNFWEDLHEHALININIDSPGAKGATATMS